MSENRSLLIKIVVSVFLVASIVAIYLQVGSHDFINCDDNDYVYANPHVRQGLTPASISWAVTAIHSGNWHPLTWISHMLDVQLFGMNPGGHHLMNVVLHAANAVLLFLLFCRMTGAVWRSAVVAFLFALHPLHVESVAWVAERKDVLSSLFGLLALYFYAHYAERFTSRRYLVVILWFSLSLMAKPMLVTLPLLLLLLDYWPLGRFGGKNGDSSVEPGNHQLRQLLIEKIPFFLIAAASSVVTLYAQREGGGLRTLAESPLSARIANALVSSLDYLGKAFLPKNLALLYPFPETLPLWQTLAAGSILVIITFLAIKMRRRSPYLLVGWLWYLITLLPVIGIVRVGSQAMADRYTYLPLVGIFMLLVWGADALFCGGNYRRAVLIITAFALLLACALLTNRQLKYWKDSFTLYEHTLAVTGDNNFLIHYNMGLVMEEKGMLDDAIHHYRQAIRIVPEYEMAISHLLSNLCKKGRLDEAIDFAVTTIRRYPDVVAVYNDLGGMLLLKGEPEAAIDYLLKAISLDPAVASSQYRLALAYSVTGITESAITHYRNALLIDAGYKDCHFNLAVALASQGKYTEAAYHFNEVLRLRPEPELRLKAKKGLEAIVLQQEIKKNRP